MRWGIAEEYVKETLNYNDQALHGMRAYTGGSLPGGPEGQIAAWAFVVIGVDLHDPEKEYYIGAVGGMVPDDVDAQDDQLSGVDEAFAMIHALV